MAMLNLFYVHRSSVDICSDLAGPRTRPKQNQIFFSTNQYGKHLGYYVNLNGRLSSLWSDTVPCPRYITVQSLNSPFPYFNSTLPSGFHKCIKASRSHLVNSVEAGGQTKWPLLRGSSHPLDHSFQFRSPIKSIRCSFGSKFICLSEPLFTVNKNSLFFCLPSHRNVNLF